MNPWGNAFALFSDDKGLVHVGPDEVDWDTYTACSLVAGMAHRTKSMFRVVGADRIATCLQCIAAMDDDARYR